MKISVSTHPPLGLVFVVDQPIITFSALLEVESSFISTGWQVSLWHSDSEAIDWTEKPLTPILDVNTQPVIFHKSENQNELNKLFFVATLSIHNSTKFTIKFRSSSDQPWRWCKDLWNTRDGTIVVKSKSCDIDPLGDLSQYFYKLDPNLLWKRFSKENSIISIWSIEALIEAAEGKDSKFKDFHIGLPWGEGRVLTWMALVRSCYSWLAPRHGIDRFELDEDAILCSFLNCQGQHLVFVALSGIDHITSLLNSDSKGNVVLRARNDGVKDGISQVLVGTGDDLESIIAEVMYHARKMVTSSLLFNSGQEQPDKSNKGVSVKRLNSEEWLDGLTYCTWNALGQRLTEEKLLAAASALAENNVNVTNFIIDDNWQSIDYAGNNQYQHSWLDFEAEKEFFPSGLKHTVESIRRLQPSIQNVAVWHAILGYWAGISPNGNLCKAYNTVTVGISENDKMKQPKNGELTIISKEDVAKFYDNFYIFLSSCGVNAVKTDVQSALENLVTAEARRELIPAYLDAWITSAYCHFGSQIISCMSQTPQISFRSQIPQNRSRILVRNSLDFYPEIPASHSWHIFSNAHNSLFSQHLNCVPDWDMFQTVHDYSRYHAAARCVSGGPICITDIPGQHDLGLIHQVTCLTSHGKSIILRPSLVGRSLNHYTGYKDGKLLLIGTCHRDTGITGCFNISQKSTTEFIQLQLFLGVKQGLNYVIRAHTTGSISRPLLMSGPDTVFSVSLNIRGYEIFSAYPLTRFRGQNKDNEISIASLGLLGKMTGAAAIIWNRITQLENKNILVETRLKGLGVFGIYISTLNYDAIKDSLKASLSGKEVPKDLIKFSEIDQHILEIDVSTIWKRLELHSVEGSKLEIKLMICLV